MRAAVRLAGAALACALTLTGCGAVRRAVAAPTTGASGPELVLGPAGIGKLRLGVPDNPDATYILFFGFGRTTVKDAKVQLMMLSLRDQDHDGTHAG